MKKYWVSNVNIELKEKVKDKIKKNSFFGDIYNELVITLNNLLSISFDLTLYVYLTYDNFFSPYILI